MGNPSDSQQGGKVRLFDLRSNWRTLLHRRTEHDPVIDGVRAFAIIWVIFFHLPFFHLGSFTAEALTVFTGPWTQWTSRGDMGVDLFFVISGYLIGTILLDEYRKTGSLQVKRFYARRFLRLIPVYVVAMLVGAPLVHNIPKSSILMDFPPWMNFDTIWANLFYVNNFLPINQQYMGWCWSLAIEEQFYLIFPAFILLFMRFRPKLQILGLMMVLSGVIRWMVIDRHGFIPPFLDTPDMQSWVDRFTIEYQNLYTRYAGLLSGVIGAYLMVYHRERVRAFFTRTAMVNVLSIVAVGLIIPTAYFALASPHFAAIPRWASELYYSHHRDVFSMCLIFLILAAVHSAGVAGRLLRAIWSGKVLYPIAQISYSLYLVHEAVMLWLFPKTAALWGPSLGAYPTMALASVIAVLLSVIFAVLLYLFVEQPCMRARSRVGFKRLTEPGLAPAAAS
jgi:peptidoglycan/LPS O-acetylase OafA/YrhL